MKSILDNGHSWILEKLAYDGDLEIYLKELRRRQPTDLVIGNDVIKNTTLLKPALDSMRVRISFDYYLSWQCLNESACTGFEGDVYDGSGFISLLSQSSYLSYILEHHGWYQDVQEQQAKHYRIWSENEVIDIVSFSEPKIILLNA